ncbi:hypothetical protein [Desmospora activa]|uniref:Uncharacterized protein n=1 Tax=Desmospora activa DSM 45169 TaxID=1121389 RepID=A0A2T4Z7N0_9BACL|nr:hypothetical protein [Desmospora activa]PTM57900.1 hypothetical protein C8J48_0465 [Desmospora activa DSM 45169]
MALDILLYQQGNLTHCDYISQSLHDALFRHNNYWRSYMTLRKLQDYYLTDLRLNHQQINQLASELEQMKIFVDKHASKQIDRMKNVLNEKTYDEAWIIGD